jgi:hypothetical protein
MTNVRDKTQWDFSQAYSFHFRRQKFTLNQLLHQDEHHTYSHDLCGSSVSGFFFFFRFASSVLQHPISLHSGVLWLPRAWVRYGDHVLLTLMMMLSAGVFYRTKQNKTKHKTYKNEEEPRTLQIRWK